MSWEIPAQGTLPLAEPRPQARSSLLLSRRHLLRGLLAGTGLGLLWALGGCAGGADITTTSVVVIGGGLSGLSAALRLGHFRPLVLERESYLGGRVRTVSLGDARVNVGLQFLCTNDFEMDDIISELGLEGARRLLPEPVAVAFDGTYTVADDYVGVLPGLPVESAVIGDILEGALRLESLNRQIQKGRRYPADPDPASAVWDELESQSARHVVSDLLPDAQRFLEMVLLADSGGTLDENSGLIFAVYEGASPEVGVFSGCYLLAGGNDLIIRELAARATAAGATILTSTEVRSIVCEPERVTVVFDGPNGRQEVRAQAAVLTIPAPLVLAMVGDLPAAKQEALAAVRYAPYLVVSAAVEEAAWRRVYGLGIAGGLAVGVNDQAVADSELAPGGVFPLCSFITGPQGRAIWNETDEEIIRRSLRELSQILPGGESLQDVRLVRLDRWLHGEPLFGPGYVGELLPTLRAPFGRLFFAGDYTEFPESGGAVHSGLRAAQEVEAALA